MKGETKYLEDILGLSARLVSSQGIKKIHIICQGVSEHILDLSDVSPGDIPLKLTELCKTDDKLKEYLGYRSIRVEHFVNDENGDREMKIFVTPISHVYKRHEDLLKKKKITINLECTLQFMALLVSHSSNTCRCFWMLRETPLLIKICDLLSN